MRRDREKERLLTLEPLVALTHFHKARYSPAHFPAQIADLIAVELRQYRHAFKIVRGHISDPVPQCPYGLHKIVVRDYVSHIEGENGQCEKEKVIKAEGKRSHMHYFQKYPFRDGSNETLREYGAASH